jgi:hypothetical protein
MMPVDKLWASCGCFDPAPSSYPLTVTFVNNGNDLDFVRTINEVCRA